MSSLSSRLSTPLAFAWSLIVSAAIVAAVAACASPGARYGGDIPRAPTAIYDALRSGYETAPDARDRAQEPLADIRGQVV